MIHFPRWKVILISLVVVWGLFYASPNLMNEELRTSISENMPALFPQKTINLGLDLQGGSHLLLEVETDVVVKERVESLIDEVRKSFRSERIGYNNLGRQKNGFVVTVRDEGDVSKARSEIRKLAQGIEVDTENDNRLVVSYTETQMNDIKRGAVSQSIEIVRRRIDETGTREPMIQAQGENRILVQLPGVDDPQQIKELLGKTAQMTFHMVDTDASVTGTPPPGTRRLPLSGERGTIVIKRRALLTGDMLVDAQPTFDQNGAPAVSFRFDAAGARKFGRVTQKNIGKPFAIVLDNEVITAPTIQSAITGGQGIITGSFTTAEANDLAILLRAGALPAPLTVMEERSVGPSLGADSVEAGKKASLVGMAAVIVFMLVSYSLFGLFANLALIINVVLLFALLSILQATLTLPGIAGIVLTVGMAVDANVLIFERIREELAAGRSSLIAIDKGYSGAMSTIMDANITTLIAAALLYNFGTGPIRGFAVTLSLGILTSLFTAIYVTRLMVALWARKRRPETLPI